MIRGALIAAVAALGVAYYFFFYPPVVLERKTTKALESFNRILTPMPREQIKAQLQDVLADQAVITLDVSLFRIGQADEKLAMQEFTKPQFIAFIDNTLYAMQEYGHEAHLTRFELQADRSVAAIALTSKDWADGTSYYGGQSVKMRFSAEPACEGEVTITGGKPQLAKLSCAVSLRSLPKPGEAGKMQNMEAIKQLLR